MTRARAFLVPRDAISMFLKSVCVQIMKDRDQQEVFFYHMNAMRLLDALVEKMCGSKEADRQNWFTVENLVNIAAACLALTMKMYNSPVRGACQQIGRITYERFGKRPNMKCLQQNILRQMLK